MTTNNNQGAATSAFIMGALFGALAALFASPASGQENRQRVKQMAHNAREKADSAKDELLSKAKDGVEKTRGKAHQAIDEAADTSENHLPGQR